MSARVVVRVRDVMKKDFDMVEGMATVDEVLKTMTHVETKCVVVNRRHEDDEFGIVMLSDIAKKVLARDKAPDRVNIYEIMTKPIIQVDPDMDIRYCARLFERYSLSRTAVVENRQVVGIVGYTDMVLRGMRWSHSGE